MKEPWSISKEKLVALEEGTSYSEEHECAKPAGRNDACKQAVQCVKLFLYLGLLVIVGWACYSIWQPYHAESMEVKVAAIIRELESQNSLLLEEQPTEETSTIAATPFYGSEESTKPDVVDYLQKFSPDGQDEILNSENTESSLGWPTSTDYPDLPKAMNFPFFLPSFPSMKVDKSEKEPGSSESAQGLFDTSSYNISEESQLLEEDEKIRLESYMLLSLFVQNSLRMAEALKDSKEVVDPKFQLELEDFGGLRLENSGSLELENSSRLEFDNSDPLEFDNSDPLEFDNSDPLEFDNSGPLRWFLSGRFEPEEEIGSDLKDSEENPISTQTDDNYESATWNILNNAHEIIPEHSTEPEQEETLITSTEEMHQSIDFPAWYAQSAFGEHKDEEEQSLLELSTARNAEASEDSTEEVDNSSVPTLADLIRLQLKDSGSSEMKDSDRLVIESLDPVEAVYLGRLSLMDWFQKWEHFGRLELRKQIDSDPEDSEENPISTQTDDNYESATLNILNNTQEIVPEDSTEPKLGEALIKSNEQMQQSSDSADEDWFDQSASEDRKDEEEQATDETEPELEDYEIPSFPYDFGDHIEDTYSLGLHSETDRSSLEDESDEESELDSFDLQTHRLLLNSARHACRDRNLYSWEQEHLEESNNDSYGSSVLDTCNERTKEYCEYRKRTLKLNDCLLYIAFALGSNV